MRSLESFGDELPVLPDDLPRLTGDFERPLGVIKRQPDDFVVEEIPAYLPCGEGEHLYLWIEKRDLSAEQLLKQIARATGVAQQDIGCAGMKDRRAITRQWVSIPAKAEDQVDTIASDQVQVLERRRHGNKLRTGHLQGNRFSILVREPESENSPVSGATPRLDGVLGQIARWGFANYYGDQRFGRDGETLQLGLDLISGRCTPKVIPYARRRFLLKLALSSVQSHLFNLALAARVRDGLATTVIAGDVMEVASGGLFVAEDATAEQRRFDAGETMVTGPLFGLKMKSPTGLPAEREQFILQQVQVSETAFTDYRDLLPGGRRNYFVRPTSLQMSQEPNGVRLQFELPAGVYATTLLEELFDLQE